MYQHLSRIKQVFNQKLRDGRATSNKLHLFCVNSVLHGKFKQLNFFFLKS